MKLTSKLKIALKSLLSISLAEIETDKAVLIFDGELAEGIEVFVKDEEAEDGVKPAENGSYETETQIIEIEDGKIIKITEKEAEKPAEEQPIEIEQAEESSEEPADEPEPAQDEPSLEDRIASLEALMGEIRGALEQILNGVASLEARVDALEEKVSKVDETPADEPADENVEIEENEHKTKAYYLRKNK